MDVWVATSCNERHGRCSHSHDDNCGQSELPQGSYTEAFTSCHCDSRSDTMRDKQLLLSTMLRAGGDDRAARYSTKRCKLAPWPDTGE